jgi:hypothetical protein
LIILVEMLGRIRLVLNVEAGADDFGVAPGGGVMNGGTSGPRRLAARFPAFG